jgi:hypothetical protein
MDAPQKIPILLAEYNALRQRLFAATLMADIAFAVSPASTIWWVPWLIGGISILYLCVVVGWNGQTTETFTRRLRELEAAINKLADNDRLLVWETDWMGAHVLENQPPLFWSYEATAKSVALATIKPRHRPAKRPDLTSKTTNASS